MSRGMPALERWSGEEFTARALTPPEPPGEGAAAVSAPPQTTLVLFDRGTDEDRRMAAVLTAAAADHADRLRVASVSASDVLPRLESWQEARRALDSFDFRRWPAVGVFRRGRLVTTFHPRRVFFAEPLQQREEREQVETFLAKMVYYDPAKVKEQKNIELEAEA